MSMARAGGAMMGMSVCDAEGARGRGMEPGRLRLLPPALQSRMRSNVCITSIGQLCEELVCNAIDAGASEVSVVVDPSAPLSVTVSDNGRGMSVGDVRVVSQRYFTSKMTNLSDLEGVTTLGFRGEALSSISDLCILEVTSRATGSFETFTRICKVSKRENSIVPSCTRAKETTTHGTFPSNVFTFRQTRDESPSHTFLQQNTFQIPSSTEGAFFSFYFQ